jgi:hypothetical protein
LEEHVELTVGSHWKINNIFIFKEVIMNQEAQNEFGVSEHNRNALSVLSLAAIAPLTDAVYTMALDPMQSLEDLRDLLRRQCNRSREDEALGWLSLVYGLLGIEYADAIAAMSGHVSGRDAFLAEYIANIDELIIELSE